MEYGTATVSRTTDKLDVDFISARLQETLKTIESCTADLTRQGDKLFGYPPEPGGPQGDRVSRDNMHVLGLLDYLDSAVTDLRDQVNRF
jgi:hypothetical protein